MDVVIGRGQEASPLRKVVGPRKDVRGEPFLEVVVAEQDGDHVEDAEEGQLSDLEDGPAPSSGRTRTSIDSVAKATVT